MASSRPIQRFLNSTHSRPTSTLRSRLQQQSSKRWASTEAAAEVSQGALARFWNSNVGPKTVHFWAPVMKWGVVLAGVADFARPAEKLSLQQNGALVATGLIWTRWCLIIKPRNLLLASVNFLLGCVGIVQVSRILAWRKSQEGKEITSDLVVEKAKDTKNKVVDKVQAEAEKLKGAVS